MVEAYTVGSADAHNAGDAAVSSVNQSLRYSGM